jgi:ABC-type Fe3+-hydroxamate transport system substrate-binding protein
MPQYTDQTGRRVYLDDIPQRIVSLVPSITEFLADLGLSERLVGITKFCIHPDSVFQNVIRVGGTKDFKVDKIANLRPDLIIANKEENEPEGIAKLASQFPVWISKISTITEAFDMMQSLGHITGKSENADRYIILARDGFSQISLLQKEGKLNVLYLIWRKPYMAAGTDTYISDVMQYLGWQNALSSLGAEGTRYPEISNELLKTLKPDIILLSSEPYPFTERHLNELAPFAVKSAQLADGEAFSWYGTRMIKSIPYLLRLQKETAG